MISEYAKRETSWNKLKETSYNEDLQTIISEYLVSTEEKENRENEKEIDTNNEEDRLFIISEIHKFGVKFWGGFSNYLDEYSLEGFNRTSVEEVLKAIQKNKIFSREILQLVEKQSNIYQKTHLFSRK